MSGDEQLRTCIEAAAELTRALERYRSAREKQWFVWHPAEDYALAKIKMAAAKLAEVMFPVFETVITQREEKERGR